MVYFNEEEEESKSRYDNNDYPQNQYGQNMGNEQAYLKQFGATVGHPANTAGGLINNGMGGTAHDTTSDEQIHEQPVLDYQDMDGSIEDEDDFFN